MKSIMYSKNSVVKMTLLLLVCCLLQNRSANAQNVRDSGRIVIKTFNFEFEGVQLLDGFLKDQFEEVKHRYLSLDNNDILYNYRKRAGRKNPPGHGLGGAFSKTGLSFGQWLGAFARMYKVTGDVDIRDKAIYLMDEWAKTIDGYYNPNHYVFDKDVQGLVDMYEYIGSKSALKYLDKIIAWGEKNLDRSNSTLIDHEWYTLSENLYRAYELTGKKSYYDFAKVWEATRYWNAFARGEDIFPLLENRKVKGYHAYSHVNSLSSAAMAYKITGDHHYLETIVNAYDFLQKTQFYATGGYGPEEQLVVPDGLPETLLNRNGKYQQKQIVFQFETACGTWAGFKLGQYLQMFTGQAKYGDWIELLLYNAIGAQPPVNKNGNIMYGSQYHLRGGRKTLSTVWFCCQGTRPLDVVDYYNLIYYHDKDNLYINLFVPSKVDWQGPNGLVTVVQKTSYPESGIVNIQVKTNHPGRFGLKFRVPGWAYGGVKIKVNNKTFNTPTIPGKWAVIERNWNFNDKVELQFDLYPRIQPLSEYVSPVAVMCGPVVMVSTDARASEARVPTRSGLRFPADWLFGRDGTIAYSWSPSMKAPIDRGKLRSDKVFRPFYKVKVGEFYRMYFERKRGTIISPDKLVFYGKWISKEGIRYAKEPGSYFEGKFKGTNVIWEGMRSQDAGMAQISIDGKEVAKVDQYGYTGVIQRLDQSNVPFRWHISGLENGEHTIKITSVKNKNPLSNGNIISIKRLLTYP